MFFDLYYRVLEISQKSKGKKITAAQLTGLMRKLLESDGFTVTTHRDPAVSPDMVIVSGIYDCWNDSSGLPGIEISLCYHPQQRYFFLDLLDWPRLAFDFAECVVHEKIHQEQHHQKKKFSKYRSRVLDKSLKSEQEYLGAGEEIEAYGFSIAADSMVNSTDWKKCDMYQVYANTFFDDANIVLKLEKSIVKYLKQLELEYVTRTRRAGSQ
jgi:hypothetical protein